MKYKFIARAEITIQAPASKVWEALTTPKIIKQYMFGVDVITDWKVGNSIIYKGIWEGKPFEDKGKILEFSPNKRLVSSYWSPFSGKPDSPEYYQTVSYELASEVDSTRVSLAQDNNASEEEKANSEKNWSMVLDGLKKVLEA